VGSSLLDYYAERADQYELIYLKPERQADLASMARELEATLAGHDVLELTCGTGYWTRRYAPVARSVLATDLSPEVLGLARSKDYPPNRVRFELADAYRVDRIPGRFTAVFAGFWWSHVPRERLAEFLARLHRRLGAGARVVFCDNRFVEGSSTPLTRRDARGNTYQSRRLHGRAEYEVLKNFPTPEEIGETLHSAGVSEIRTTQLTFYWCVSYLTGNPAHSTTG
jgi:SAM-dependent methyltransferase